MKTASFGSISSCTMNPKHLIPTFVWELEQLVEGNEYADLIEEANAYDPDDESTGDGYEILSRLFDALSEASPPYAYFGAHPSDRAEYGWWLSDSFNEDFDGLKVDDTSEVPDDYSGEVAHINDHGNVTLYAAHEGKLTEIWALV